MRPTLPRAACVARSGAPFVALLTLVLLGASACVSRASSRKPVGTAASTSAARTSPSLPEEMRGAPREELVWASFDAATFARAKTERKLVILDGAAEWCHWCHVMEAETYHDRAVRELIDARFIAAKVDIDARPDIADRYADYGWPATVIFSPDGEELGKYRGFLAPDDFLEILRDAASGKAAEEAKKARNAAGSALATKPAVTTGSLDLTARWTELLLDDLWDDAQGGWGTRQKLPCGWNNAWALSRGARPEELKRRNQVLFVLQQQRRLIDPVWGGMYQYSIPGDWDHPHFEKLMTTNAAALDNYAAAYALTKDERWLAAARSIRGYVESFLLSPAGGFFTTQDADANAHAAPHAGGKPFVDGHIYFAKDDAARRALGLPRVDTHEYARENGLAVAAYATLYAATKDASALSVAKRAALRILETHGMKTGALSHAGKAPDAKGPASSLLHLADNAAMGWGLVRLAEVSGGTPEDDPRVLDGARKIADFLLNELEDKGPGGFFAHTVDPAAVGIFAARRKPFDSNVLAIRFLAKLHARSPDPRYPLAVRRAMAHVIDPDAVRDQGRLVGELLSAIDETRGLFPAVPPS